MGSGAVKRSVILQSEARILIAPAENTWRTPHSAKRKLRKLRGRLFGGLRARTSAAARRCSFLTLTVAHTKTPKEAYDDMRESWNALATWWRKAYPKMKFFRVVELHADGFPHFHMLLIGAPWIAQKKIAEQWAGLLGQAHAIVDIRKVKGDEHAVRYVTKYLLKQSEKAGTPTKSTPSDSGDSLDTQTLKACESTDLEAAKPGRREIADASWWGARVRPWSASRGLLAPVEKAPAWWDSVSVKDRVTVSEVAYLANAHGMTVEAWDDETGFYNLVRDPEPPEPANAAPSVLPATVLQRSRPITQEQTDAIERARVQREKWRSRISAPAPLESGLKVSSGSWVAPWARDARDVDA